MATRGIALEAPFIAWDTANNVGKTGLTTIVLQVIRTNGGIPSLVEKSGGNIIEVDALKAPGAYSVSLSGADCDVDMLTLAGVSGVADVSIMPVNIQFERLPDVAPGLPGGVLDMRLLY